ncbi:hypothetical protein AB0K16_25735 [Nonomuraea jabiensis]|uniref:hypothetical protein n=1 Tax=Nonomuraea jabiensis TaxID=882448 RepID=UPI003431126F
MFFDWAGSKNILAIDHVGKRRERSMSVIAGFGSAWPPPVPIPIPLGASLSKIQDPLTARSLARYTWRA